MTNDIASELALLHTLKGAAYVSQLKAIAARKEFHPLNDDPNIFTVGGEKDTDYPFLLFLQNFHEAICDIKKSCRSNS